LNIFKRSSQGPSPIYVISGGTGASAEKLVHTLLVQFPEYDVPVLTSAHVCETEQLEEVVARAQHSGGTIVHTFVDSRLRRQLIHMAADKGVVAIDLFGPLIDRLCDLLGKEPLGQPGLYRRLHQEYFNRVNAIEFTLAHDDGMNPQDLSLAEIVLVGVSRVGKTPLSVYLSVLGWKVANIPVILGLPPPEGLFTTDPRRVIGLEIESGHLMMHRRQRLDRIGVKETTNYTDLVTIREELEAARAVFRRGSFPVIDVTDKPIESSAQEVTALITRRLKEDAHKR